MTLIYVTENFINILEIIFRKILNLSLDHTESSKLPCKYIYDCVLFIGNSGYYQAT